MGFSPLASHCRTAGSPRRAVWFLNLISNCGGASQCNKSHSIRKAINIGVGGFFFNIKQTATLDADKNNSG